MEWLNDKKNQPIVAAIAVVVIIGAGVAMYMLYFRGDSAGSMEAATELTPAAESTPASSESAGPTPPSTASAPTTSSSQPSTSAAAGAGKPRTTGQAQVAAVPAETFRADPFLPVGYKPKPKPTGPQPKPRIPDFPFYKFPPIVVRPEKIVAPEPAQPSRRMAGRLISDRIYAIIESDGKSEIVWPGYRLSDGLAVVERIEDDKVILRTTSERPRAIVVTMAASPMTASSSSGDTSGGSSPSVRSPRAPSHNRRTGPPSIGGETAGPT